MNLDNQLSTYNIQSIIALNDHLVSLKKLDDIFNYLSSFLKQDFSISQYKASINENLIYTNYENDDEEKYTKEFNINLNQDEELILKIASNNEVDLNNSSSLIKNIISIVSQTIYNKYLEYKLKELTLKDTITGMYNRHYIDEYLKTTLPLTFRENKKLAFLKVGIDHFKAVIDEFDYTVGDKVLKELAKSLEHCVRKSDIIARIDSDEFLVVLHNVSCEDNAIMIADKIINNFKNVKVVVDEEKNQTLMKTICAGISIYPDDAQKIEEVFRSSDIALYEARNKGRSQFFKYKKEEVDSIDLF